MRGEQFLEVSEQPVRRRRTQVTTQHLDALARHPLAKAQRDAALVQPRARLQRLDETDPTRIALEETEPNGRRHE
jgi:hypothetical protein